MAILVKILIVLLLVTILFNLFKAMTVMLKNDPKRAVMSHYIGKRLFFSVALILLLLLALALGIIEPNARPY